jgi:hypothetical protein
MAETGKPLNREEMEAAIRHFDNEIRGIRQGIFLEASERDYDPNSESAQKAEEALKFYLQQKEMMVTELKRLDSTDAF